MNTKESCFNSSTSVSVADTKPPMKVELSINQTDFSLQVILAVLAVITTLVNSVAAFGDDNGGKRLAVMSSISFSSLIVAILVKDHCSLLILFILSSIVFLVAGLFAMWRYKK